MTVTVITYDRLPSSPMTVYRHQLWPFTVITYDRLPSSPMTVYRHHLWPFTVITPLVFVLVLKS